MFPAWGPATMTILVSFGSLLSSSSAMLSSAARNENAATRAQHRTIASKCFFIITFRESRRNFIDALNHDIFHHVAGDVGEPEIAARVTVRELLVIQAQQMQHGRVQIVHVNFVF